MNKSPVRMVNNFIKDYVSPYKERKEASVTPTKNFKLLNVQKIKSKTPVRKLQSQATTKTPEKTPTRTPERTPDHSSSFISKIPRLNSNQKYHTKQRSGDFSNAPKSTVTSIQPSVKQSNYASNQSQ